ncbi:MAG: hypothetical protein ACP5MH_11245 [Thermoproteus sp.]
MRCVPLDKNHEIDGVKGNEDGPICDAVCDCVAVECKSALSIDGDVAAQLKACLKRVGCPGKKAAFCFQRMRMPGRYVLQYYRAELGVDVLLNPREICAAARCS